MNFGSVEEKVIYSKLSKRDHDITGASVNDVQDQENMHNLLGDVSSTFNRMNSLKNITSYRPIWSGRKFIGQFVVFIKKAIRKLLFWYIEPICEQQMAFNNSVVMAIMKLENVQKPCFSQAGEDMVVLFALMAFGIPLKKTSYLDLGANHAKEISNTFYFYRHGARGVLVEANPALIPELKLFRNQDVILNRCVTATKCEPVDFYVLNGNGLSTPDKDAADEFIKANPSLSIEKKISVESITVNEIIEVYFDKPPTILNIDIEGSELEILNSIDFERYRPFVIIVEMIPYMLQFSIKGKNQEIMDFMKDNDYYEYAFTGINSIFIDKKQLAAMGRFIG